MKRRSIVWLIASGLTIILLHGALAQAPASEKTITLADDGSTITLGVNESFLLKLGEGYDWNITIDDQTVVSRVVNVFVVRGAQGIYRAHKPGRATLTAVGDPQCRKAIPPCEAPSREFRLHIVVKSASAPAFEIVLAVAAVMLAPLVGRR